ncbi:hypothetical protein HK102_001717, partial [Quaeritorhiza haematococci]
HRIQCTIAAYHTVSLHSATNALVFTGGIGEHSSYIRRRICEGLGPAFEVLGEESGSESGGGNGRTVARGVVEITKSAEGVWGREGRGDGGVSSGGYDIFARVRKGVGMVLKLALGFGSSVQRVVGRYGEYVYGGGESERDAEAEEEEEEDRKEKGKRMGNGVRRVRVFVVQADEEGEIADIAVRTVGGVGGVGM